MARKMDTGWRDRTLTDRHKAWGHSFPVAGMSFPMVEYDRGQPLAVISYIRRGVELPTGPEISSAYLAFGRLCRKNGDQLPFLTVQYDVRNWAYRVFPHNAPAREFLGAPGWHTMTETQYADTLYRLRGRLLPDLAPFGVTFAWDEWIGTEPSPDFAPAEAWPGQLLSQRRRCFEPGQQVRASWRNPCLDIDLAVIDQDDHVSLLVDYKAAGARANLNSMNVSALCNLHAHKGSPQVATMVVSYTQTEAEWSFHVAPVNRAGGMLLSYVLGGCGTPEQIAQAVASRDGVGITEVQWREVLGCARDL